MQNRNFDGIVVPSELSIQKTLPRHTKQHIYKRGAFMKVLLLLTMIVALFMGPSFCAFAQETPDDPDQDDFWLEHSAEILTMGAQDDFLQGWGFDWLSDEDSLFMVGTESFPQSYKCGDIRDVAASDFDGDLMDEVVVAWNSTHGGVFVGIPTIDPETMVPDPAGWHVPVPLGASGVLYATAGLADLLGGIRIVAGNFYSDEAMEFVLAYLAADSTVALTVFDVDSATSVPIRKGEISDQAVNTEVPQSQRRTDKISRFDLVTGDYDGDGLDEIILVVNDPAQSPDSDIVIAAYDYDTLSHDIVPVSKLPFAASSSPDHTCLLRLMAASGNFDADSYDEIAIMDRWADPLADSLRIGALHILKLNSTMTTIDHCQYDTLPSAPAWAPAHGVDGEIFALATYNGKLIAGGRFDSAGNISVNNIAAWDGSSWSPLGSGLTGYSVWALAIYKGDLIAGGYFDGGRIARWDGSNWHSMGWMNNEVLSLTVYNEDLIAGGYFTNAGGVPANRIARWDGSNWHALGTGMPGVEDEIRTLTVYNGELIAGGGFYNAGGVSVNNIARWNGSAWMPLGDGIGFVDALTVYQDSLLIAGGSFDTAGSEPANNIARWNGSTWLSLGDGTGGWVTALTTYEGELIAGGYFASAGGIAANSIARWDGSDWYPLGPGIQGICNSIHTLTTYNNDIIAGGDFRGRYSTVGYRLANRIACWDGSYWYPLGLSSEPMGIAVGNIAENLPRDSIMTDKIYVTSWYFDFNYYLRIYFNQYIRAYGFDASYVPATLTPVKDTVLVQHRYDVPNPGDLYIGHRTMALGDVTADGRNDLNMLLLDRSGETKIEVLGLYPDTASVYALDSMISHASWVTASDNMSELVLADMFTDTIYFQTTLDVGGLTIFADSIEETDPDIYRVMGDVNINGAAFLPDTCTVDMGDESIAGDGEIYVPTDVPLVGDVTVYDGPFTFYVSEDSIGFSGVDDISFRLGAFEISLNQMIVLVADTGVSLSGSIVIPPVIEMGWGGDTALYIDDLCITRANGIELKGAVKWHQTFPLDLKCIKLQDGLIYYYADSLGGLWGGGISAEVADWVFGVYMQFADGDLNALYIKTDFAEEIPIGATGMFWKGMSGGFTHIAPSDPQPPTVGIWTKIVGGAKIPTADKGDVYIFTLDTVGATVSYPPLSFNATGRLKLLDEIKIGFAEATFENRSFSYEAEMKLFGIYKGWMNGHISGAGYYGSCGGSIKTPSYLPWWLKWARNKKIGYSEADARFDEDTKFIRGKARIKVCFNYWFGKKCKKYSLAYRFHLNSSSPYLHFALGTNYGNLKQIFKSKDGEKLSATYVIPEQTEYVMFFIRQENPDLPEFYLVNPDDDTIGVEHVQYSDTLGYTELFYSDSVGGEIDPAKDSMDIVYGAFYTVDNPAVGQWDVYVPAMIDDSMEIFVNSPNLLPSIRLLRPAVPDDANMIKWEANDFDDEASITFYFDDDNTGFDGWPVNDTEIKEGSKVNSITWDNTDVDPGEYYIYAVIEDSVNCPVRLYSEGTIVVEGKTNVIPPPTIHIGEVVDSTVSLAWTSVPGYPDCVVMFRDTLDAEESFVTGATVSDTTALVYGLIRGHTYEFRAAAVTSEGEIGQMSEGLTLKLTDLSGNNSPVITSLDPPLTAVVGELYEYQLTVEDDDGDFDRFELIDRYSGSTPEGIILVDGLIQWHPDEEQTGVSFIEIWAIDLAGHSDTLKYILTILEPEMVNSADVRLNSNTYRGLESVAYINVDYYSLDLAENKIDTLQATVISSLDNTGLVIDCIETAQNSNEFNASFGFAESGTQDKPPKIKIASSDAVIVSVATGDGVELGADKAIWYNCPDSCNMFDMQIMPDEWSLNWITSHSIPEPAVPPIQVVLTDRDGEPWEVTSIVASSLRLNGLIAPVKGVATVIDSSAALNRMILEFNPYLAVYSMDIDSISCDSLSRVTISGLFQNGEAFCATGAVTINDDPLPNGYCGDANNDEIVNILDITYLVNYLYKGGLQPQPLEKADVNGDATITILDITYLINYLYKGGPAPNCP